jgi:hypothetical protein
LGCMVAHKIIPTITDVVCIARTFDLNHGLGDPALQPALGSAPPVFERAQDRHVPTSEWGVLNEDELLIWLAGQCPFCCALLSSEPTSLAGVVIVGMRRL